jgi:hypothetical protein
VQWAVTTSVDYSLAQLIQVIILLGTGGKNGGGYLASKYVVIAFHAAILLSHAVINSLPITLLSFFGQFAAAWNMLGVFVLMIAVPTVATELPAPSSSSPTSTPTTAPGSTATSTSSSSACS